MMTGAFIRTGGGSPADRHNDDANQMGSKPGLDDREKMINSGDDIAGVIE
jgi:hypothetical protein